MVRQAGTPLSIWSFTWITDIYYVPMKQGLALVTKKSLGKILRGL